VILIIDYLISKTPFLMRQSKLMIIFSGTYTIFNFAYTKTNGEPIYQIINWETYKSYIFSILLILVHLGVFFAIQLMTIQKLKYCGHQEFVEGIICSKINDIKIEMPETSSPYKVDNSVEKV